MLSTHKTESPPSGAKQADNSVKTKKSTVKKVDGTKLFGFVEITDDYTIRITSDSGIIRLPIAELSDADFRKYGFRKDRSKDGRFRYERKEALKDSKKDPKSEKEASGKKSIAEIRLAEISAFQPFIAAYEKTLAPNLRAPKKRAQQASQSRRLTLPVGQSSPCFPS